MNSSYATTKEPSQAEILAAKLDELSRKTAHNGAGQDADDLNLFRAINALNEQMDEMGKAISIIMEQLAIHPVPGLAIPEPQPQHMIEVLALRVNGARHRLEGWTNMARVVSQALSKLQP